MPLDPALVRRVQDRVGVKADGIFGPQTLAAVAEALEAAGEFFAHAGIREEPSAATQPVTPKVTPVTLEGTPADPRSEKNIATLLPQVRPLARRLLAEAARRGIVAKVTSGSRSYAEQAELRRRSEAGGPKAAPAGWSNHNFGLAFDITLFSSAGKPIWESPNYRTLGQLGKALGLTWGGDWPGRDNDEPHFSLRPTWAASMTERELLTELRARKQSGKPIFAA